MLTINDIRSIYPEYNDLTDYELSTAFHRARYADVPYKQFAEGFGGPLEEDKAKIVAEHTTPPTRRLPSPRRIFETRIEAGYGVACSFLVKAFTML